MATLQEYFLQKHWNRFNNLITGDIFLLCSVAQGSPVAHNKKKILHEQGYAGMLLDHCGSQKPPMTKSGGQGFG